ncbi:MAG TPA: alanine dehydrogenase [Candidatus Acidoferrales bacterium]|nr:alanine dehydrogenase [Candidatus Acidoferrales bacterium]
MIIGIPKEIKAEENRVAMTPAGVSALVAHGHRVLVQRHAGEGSGLSDAQYRGAGAEVVGAARDVWRRAEMIVKVKEPLPSEYRYLRDGLVVFTYLHLAASRELTRVLRARKVQSIGYETIQLDDGSLPLLAPMSEVAGRLSIQVGAWCLQKQNGGAGILLGGASGVRPAKVVILGAGIAGASACQIAAGVGAHVSIVDLNPARLRYLHDILGGHLTTVMSNRANIEEEVSDADLLVGSVLVAGAKAPHLVTRKMVKAMKPGSAVVDISIDQGGCIETSRPTTLDDPIYVAERVVHYCVTNMPAIVPRTSTFALTNATLSYALELADKGLPRALRENAPLRRGVNVYDGNVVHAGVADAFGFEHKAIEQLV